ncbi:MAG: uncharacterized protein QOH03_4125 [Kribbellaceae bacterium]|jgi:uncharacterized protein YcgI (DUF1989 family)|nr:uncharacterized protein [Kribbellaceae bacterium]
MSYQHSIPADAVWSFPVRADRLVRLTALGPDANATVLIVAADRVDRLNVPDTLKSQMSACVRPGLVLMSDRGFALATVVESSLEWHDCLAGIGSRDGLVVELTKYGLGEVDLHGSINFFSKVAIADDSRASMAYVPGHAVAGDSVVLRTSADLLIFVSTAAHPLSGLPAAGVSVEVSVADGPGPAPLRDEAGRALEMTRRAAL